MKDRQQAETLVAQFLAHGGRIRKLPEPASEVTDLLDYLREQNIDVYPTGTPDRYLYRGHVVDLRRVLILVNLRRYRQNMPPIRIAATGSWTTSVSLPRFPRSEH